ncbi:Hypothetical protein CGLY_06435 [Corynebacterium glyciniphilum AJ 3170]|uniref:Uncharacterized protein n=1 Tax=Corynebacterium glyciniphilum AJ 3170 TaxID=1404245 RepID=X5DST4_9CORY|nr:hypothetical protein [Corynebacterium glyciniphilum]AHW63732.1 Hypothetical protein CGLY_06435 [Corynebacterium glyciniphilum AJ 3170]
MNQFTRLQVNELKRLLKASNERVDSLENRVSVLESKYRAALTSIRRLLQRHPESADVVADDIRHDL